MSFLVDNTQFYYENNISDILDVKSFNKTYTVYYSSNTLKEHILNIYNKNDFLIIDRNVYNLDIKAFDNISNIFILDATEDNKTIHTILKIIDELISLKFTKKNKLVVVGGGITQDIGGFVAAIYKRGIEWVFVPTTLLAMSDSCIGGKVGINHTSKNVLALFVAPNQVYVSNYFLESLTQDMIISGLGESLKLSVIGGMQSYELFMNFYLEKKYIDIIKLSSCIKKSIIEYDEFEKNERKVLNLGHTFGHALEATTNYFIPHGIAVLIGMYIINVLFYKNKYDELNCFILNMIDKKFFNINIDINVLTDHLLNNKKNDGANICFILLDDIGNSIFKYSTIANINDEMKKIINNLFRNEINDT